MYLGRFSGGPGAPAGISFSVLEAAEASGSSEALPNKSGCACSGAFCSAASVPSSSGSIASAASASRRNASLSRSVANISIKFSGSITVICPDRTGRAGGFSDYLPEGFEMCRKGVSNIFQHDITQYRKIGASAEWVCWLSRKFINREGLSIERTTDRTSSLIAHGHPLQFFDSNMLVKFKPSHIVRP